MTLAVGAANFSDKNYGIGKTVTASTLSLSGAQSGNYQLSAATATDTADITAKDLTVSATGVNKTYDGTNTATVTLNSNKVPTDTVILAYTSASFDDPSAGNNKPVSVSGISISGTDAGNYNLLNTTASTTANITQATTITTAKVSGQQIRYKDLVTLSATVKPLNTASALTGSVAFNIGTGDYGSVTVVPIPGATDGSVQATVIVQENELPGSYTVTATFTSTNGNYSGSFGTTSLTVIPRDASPLDSLRGFYTGDLWAWTTGTSSSTATVTLSTTLKDTGTPPGDLRAAKVTFYFVGDGNTLSAIPSAQNLPVGLVNITDGTVGTASAIVQLNIGNNVAGFFKIAVGVSGGYTNDPLNLESQDILTVSKPVGTGQMVGAGVLLNRASSGLIKAQDGSRTLWDFNITYTKSGTNPKGKVEFTFTSYNKPDGTLDSVLHTYEVKSNAIASLAVKAPTASFSSKANVTDITNPNAPVGIDSGTVLQITVTDNGNNGGTDKLGITLQRKAGGLWYSSSWDKTKTIEILTRGNINIGY